MRDTKGGAAYWLWEQGQEVERSIERLTTDIEDFERKIVDARARRDDLRLIAAEMRAAQNLIESAGLKVERVGSEVRVSLAARLHERTEPQEPGS